MPVGGYSGSTYSDVIEKAYRRLTGGQRESVLQVTNSVALTDTTLNVAGLATVGLHSGGLLAMGTEVMLVVNPNINASTQTGSVTVMRGYQGSTPSTYASGTVGYVDPRFTRWDVAVAINDALGYLSSPSYGMFQVLTTTITYNPVFRGYDLSALPANFIRLVELTFDTPLPDHNFPAVKNFRIRRGITSAKIPSGRALIVSDAAWPGLNMMVAAACPYTPLVNLTDDVEVASGLDGGATDVLALCAEIDVAIVQEIKRGELGSQTDPSKLVNVPPGATTAAVMSLKMIRDDRVAAEAARLAQRWPEIPQGY